MSTPRLVAVRHAPTDVAGLCIGRTNVLPTMTAVDAARHLETFSTTEVDLVWTSPLTRCRTLAAVIAQPRAPRVDERLLEMDFGSWEGRRWQDIESADAEAMTDWMERWETEGPPGGGESARTVAKRVKSWWDELDPGTSHLLVAHAGVVRALLVVVEGLDWSTAMTREVPHLEPITIHRSSDATRPDSWA